MKKLSLFLLVGLVFSISFLFYFRYVKAQNLLQEYPEPADEVFNRLIEEARQNGLVEVVINLKISVAAETALSPSELESQRARINQAQQDLLTRLKGFRVEVIRQFPHIPSVIAKVDTDALRFLELEKENLGVQKAEPISLTANRTSTIMAENKSGNLTSIIDSQVSKTKTGTAKSYRTRVNTSQKIPIAPKEEEEDGEEFYPPYSIDEAPGDNAVTPNPPTSVDESLLPEKPAEKSSFAPGDMRVFSYHDMNSAEAPTALRASVSEPSVVNIGNGVFYTSNWFAARSLDGGQTFSFINPGSTFPSVNGGFCCDQVTAYAPAQDMILWGLQYSKDSSNNTFRIARTIGVSGLSSNQWIYWNFSPQSFGITAGYWLDFPSMSVSGSYLYITSNIFTVSGNGYAGCVVWRISLSQLAAGGSINFSYLVYPAPAPPALPHIISLRLTEGASATMHWVSVPIDTPSVIRLSHWADSGTQITTQEIAVNSFNPLSRDGFAFSPDGTNWAGRADSRVQAGYVSNGVIGAMWGAKQGGAFPYPYIIHARFNESTGALIYQGAIWNPNFAWLYPASSINSAGNLGGVISYGGGQFYPNSDFWAIDDISNTLPLGANFAAAASNFGPGSNSWGDYLSVKPHKQYPNTWVAAMFYMNGGQSDSNTASRYLWFGRERDAAAVTHRPFDFDGDAKSDISIFRPSNGQWWYLKSSNGANAAFQFGASTDKITPGDFTGDGKTDVAIFRPSNGNWFILRSEDFSYYSFPFGVNGDIPAPADFDADGKADAAVFRPSNSTWYINKSTGGTAIQAFGQSGDFPAVADYDGDGRADIAIWRASAGQWWINRSASGTIAFQFGNSNDKPIQGDYTGDGKADVAIWRPSTGEWFVLRSENFSYYSFPFGTNGDVPAPGDYDGDGRFDATVFRPSQSTWYVQRTTAGTLIQPFGIAGDKPVPNAFVP